MYPLRNQQIYSQLPALPGSNSAILIILVSFWDDYTALCCTVPKIRNKYSQKWNCAVRPCSQFQHSSICERFIYIPTIGPQMQYSKIARPIVGIYIDIWMQKSGTRPHSFISEYLFWIFGAVQWFTTGGKTLHNKRRKETTTPGKTNGVSSPLSLQYCSSPPPFPPPLRAGCGAAGSPPPPGRGGRAENCGINGTTA